MESNLHLKYENVSFTPEVIKMFGDILLKDDVNRSILHCIASKQVKYESVSVNHLVETIRTVRRVRVNGKKKSHFVERVELIDRKSAERLVDKLASMSLIYYEPMPPYKMLFLTKRGAQVLTYLEETKRNQGGEV